jgi:hypothetical protein
MPEPTYQYRMRFGTSGAATDWSEQPIDAAELQEWREDFAEPIPERRSIAVTYGPIETFDPEPSPR